ncbi:MAG: ATP-dependent sacrificial sulfur transferase LarE [Lachnospiraceae bacterium]|nr:ATP-dependent sacrificial sulfur transferase LarE [Lachnospiraceae bacterium]
MDEAERKYEVLKEYLKSLGSVALAFSGGVDSTFLLMAAKEALGDDVLAVTACACLFPEVEQAETEVFCREHHIRQEKLSFDVLSVSGFRENPPNRCYLCKYSLFVHMAEVAKRHGISHIVEGSNMDDRGDYRPGMQAVKELGIKSPLQEAGLYKSEIRRLSKAMGLNTWDKPSLACLASRFVYGETIDEDKLGMVEKAEQKLRKLGFRQVRVRIHGGLARIEVPESELPKLMQDEVRVEIYRYLQELGFTYVALDLEGYRTGSMNEALI